MTFKEKEILLDLCKSIKSHSESIAVRENFNNQGIKSYFLNELPQELAISHAIRFIEMRIEALFQESELEKSMK